MNHALNLDPPGPSFILRDDGDDDDGIVIKGQSITLTCDVDDMGQPVADDFVWMRGGHIVNDVRTQNWTIQPVTLETEANISCMATNLVGDGAPDFISIDVSGTERVSDLCSTDRPASPFRVA